MKEKPVKVLMEYMIGSGFGSRNADGIMCRCAAANLAITIHIL